MVCSSRDNFQTSPWSEALGSLSLSLSLILSISLPYIATRTMATKLTGQGRSEREREGGGGEKEVSLLKGDERRREETRGDERRRLRTTGPSSSPRTAARSRLRGASRAAHGFLTPSASLHISIRGMLISMPSAWLPSRC
jgi:hypothetical protein